MFLIIATGAMITLFFNAPAMAAGIDVLEGACSGGGNSEVCNSGGTLNDLWANIINALIYLIGAVAVVMIVISGFRYVTANGDQSQITGAKNTLIYSIVGLVLAIMAGGIVTFVLGRLG